MQRPVIGTVAALATETVSFPPGAMVAPTPDAFSDIRSFTFCASSSMVGLTTGNVERASYFAIVPPGSLAAPQVPTTVTPSSRVPPLRSARPGTNAVGAVPSTVTGKVEVRSREPSLARTRSW